jgi:hypothetical protein
MVNGHELGMKVRRYHGSLTTARLILLGVIAATAALGTTAVIASNSGSPTVPPAKQAYLDREAQARDQAAARNAAQGITKANAPAPGAAPLGGQMATDPQSAAGDGVIIESTVAPAGETGTLVKNRWYLSLGNAGFLAVFAGCDSNVPSEGVVLVSHGPGAPVERFVLPGSHGCLSITGATGRTLRLVAVDGFTTNFDSSAQAFK